MVVEVGAFFCVSRERGKNGSKEEEEVNALLLGERIDSFNFIFPNDTAM